MAQAVVHLLEAFEVHDREGEGVAVALRPLELLFQEAVKGPAVGEAREGVGEGGLFQELPGAAFVEEGGEGVAKKRAASRESSPKALGSWRFSRLR